MKLYLCGQKQFGAAVLELARRLGHTVVGVSAPLEGGRGVDRLRAAALEAGIPVALAGSLRAETLPDGVDLIVAAHSHDYIGRKTRRKSRLGALGYHPSLLPHHRGRDAVKWALRMGDYVTGGSIYWLDDNVDGGPIAAQRHVFIHPKDTAESLWRERLFPLGLDLFAQVFNDLERGLIVSIPQDNRLATWEPALDPPPLFRPELPQIGPPPDGFIIVRAESMLSGRER